MIFCAIFGVITTVNSAAASWQDSQGGYLAQKLNPLRFTNRARCAADSKVAADSVFLLVNNFDLGKGVYRLGKLTGQETSSFTKSGIAYYRSSIVEMIKLIHHRIITRRLPLLSANVESSSLHIPRKYKSIIKNCPENGYCPELDDYVSQVWNRRTKNISVIDNFDLDDNFVESRVFERGGFSSDLNCYRLKKMGPLQSHLFGTKPNKAILDQMAQNLLKSDEYLESCFEKPEELTDVQVSAYQFEIPSLRDGRWKRKGFDYWNSMKIYLSWAFRNASELESMAGPFQNVFKSVALEDSVLFFANGCKSISAPECSSDYLAQNAMRELAKKDFARNAYKSDLLNDIPDGPAEQLLKDRAPKINLDDLEFGKFESVDKWLKNYTENHTEARNILKRQLLKASTFLGLATKSVPAYKLKQALVNQFYFNTRTESLDDSTKQELYYLCSEFNFAGHETYSFLKPKLDLLKQSTTLDVLLKDITADKVSNYMAYYQEIASFVTKSCSDLRQKNVWNNEFTLNKEGYAKWYVNKVLNNSVESAKDSMQADYINRNGAFLSYTGASASAVSSSEAAICASPSDCARKMIESVIHMHKAIQYADTFFHVEQKINSPALLNPYAERVACGVYDPWFKTKSIIFNLIWDVGQAALNTAVPGIIYTRATLKPKTVTSFKQLVKDGKISYDVNYDKTRIATSLAADFGPLLGVPCSVSIHTGIENVYDQLNFTGISLAACNEKEEHNINAFSAGDIRKEDEIDRAGCVACRLNFEGVSTVAAYAANQVDSQFFIFRGLVRLLRDIQDPDNIPRSWSVDPKELLATYRNYGEVPKDCVRDLSKGRSCRPRSCENKASEYITKNYNLNIRKVRMEGKYHTRVWTDRCEYPFKLFVSERSDDNGGNKSCRVVRTLEMPRCARSFKK